MSYTFQSHKNFVTTTIATPPSPAAPSTGATSVFTVSSGSSSSFPQSFPYNCIVYTAGVFPTYLNTEVVTVTAINTGSDTITVTRGAESSNVQTIVTGNVLALTLTAKALTDLETAVNTDNATLATATSNITTNTTNIATNTSSIATINTSLSTINSEITSINTSVAANTSSISSINSTISGLPSYSDIHDNTSTHKIGINNSSPAYTLDVTGDINFSGTLYNNGVIYSSGGGGSYLPDLFDDTVNHRIGIYQSAPAFTLDVNGTIGNGAANGTTTILGGPGLYGYHLSAGGAIEIIAGSAGSYYNTGTETYYSGQGGTIHVTAGSTAADHTNAVYGGHLYLSSGSAVTGPGGNLYIDVGGGGTSNGNILINTLNTGAVGIGISTPDIDYALDINGSIGMSINGNANYLQLDDGSGNTNLTSVGLLTLSSAETERGFRGTSLALSNTTNNVLIDGNLTSLTTPSNSLTLDNAGDNGVTLTSESSITLDSSYTTLASTYNIALNSGNGDVIMTVKNAGVTFNSGNVRFKAGTGWQWFNSTTGLWHTKLCIGNPPQDAWDTGDSSTF